jgi:uncharacterized phage protein gp47/JayE
MITIPTIAELQADILADLEMQFGANIPTFGKSFLRALALVQAAKLKLYYLAIANLQKNIFVDTAEPESIGGTLERFGRVKLNRNPFPAQPGYYDLEVTGTISAVIPAQTTFKSNDDSAAPGKLFILDEAFTLTTTTDIINVRALEPGIEAKLSIGDQLTATAPILNVSSTATVDDENIAPLAAETVEDYRAKALDAYRLEPQGGAATDYRLWSADAQGVKQTYPYAKTGAANEINVYVEATIADSTDGKGTPGSAILDEVAEVIEYDPDTTRPIEERGRRPLGVFDVHVLPVTIRTVNVNVASFTGITPAIETALTTAITDTINAVRPFVASADILANKNDILDKNKIINAILTARPGSVFGTITLNVDGMDYTSYTFLDGNIPWVDTVTFV